jgi:GNAT superfamily N-acetyltransferase
VSITIRPAQRAADARSIAEIHVVGWQRAYRDLLPARYLDSLHTAELGPRWLQRVQTQARLRPVACDLWVIEEHGAVAGFALIGPCRDGEDTDMAGFAGEVLMLYVHPQRQGAGLGRKLLERALEILAERGYHWLVIWVLEGNHRAQQFYQRSGLRPDGTRRWDRFDGRSVPVVRFARALNPVLDLDALIRSYA